MLFFNISVFKVCQFNIWKRYRTDLHTHKHTHTHIRICIYIYSYIYILNETLSTHMVPLSSFRAGCRINDSLVTTLPGHQTLYFTSGYWHSKLWKNIFNPNVPINNRLAGTAQQSSMKGSKWEIVEMIRHSISKSLRWRHNGRDGVSNHQPHDCLHNRVFRRRSKETSKLCVTGLCAGNSPGIGEFPAQKASNAKNVSIWWRHHALYRYKNTILPTQFGNRISVISPQWDKTVSLHRNGLPVETQRTG